jgi:hypothetical protein
MSTVLWNDILQGVAPITGGQALPPGTYRLVATAGEGKLNSNDNVMLALTFEVASGPLKGRKAFHNENLASDTSDKGKQRMGYFLGLLQAYGISGQDLAQWFAGRAIDVETIDYLAKQLVARQQIIKASCRPQTSDPTRINWSGWMADDGIEPEPPKGATGGAPAGPSAPGMPFGQPGPGGAPGGSPFPQGGLGAGPGGLPPQNQQQTGAQQPGGGMPLGGFPGSASPQGAPNAGPEWANQQQAAQPPVQQFAGPGQTAPAAQPQAAGMNQFQQPAQGQFPGQQFQGQVDPANFPPQNQAPQQAPAGQQLPGMPAQQPQGQAPNGLPQGGFPPVGQAPQASF